MSKIVPLTEKKVNYASCIYQASVDGPNSNPPKITKSLSSNCTIVSIMVEFLETPTVSSGTPLCYITSSGVGAGVNLYQFFMPTSYSAGDVINLPPNPSGAFFPEKASGILGVNIVYASLTAGKFVVTVGYLETPSN